MHVKDIWMENLNVKVPKTVGVEKPSGVFKQGRRK